MRWAQSVLPQPDRAPELGGSSRGRRAQEGGRHAGRQRPGRKPPGPGFDSCPAGRPAAAWGGQPVGSPRGRGCGLSKYLRVLLTRSAPLRAQGMGSACVSKPGSEGAWAHP